MKGLLITLEGIDGSGKTTASGILAYELMSAFPKKRFVFTTEPTTERIGELLRSSHLAEANLPMDEDIGRAMKMEELLLFMADHADHLARKVIPAMREGAVVISDRYADSTAAYQGVTLKGIVADPVEWIRDLYRPWNVVPHLTLLFALDPALAVERIRYRHGAQKGPEKFEREDFLVEVDANFRLLAEMERRRFALIDASGSIQDVAGNACAAITRFIGNNLP